MERVKGWGMTEWFGMGAVRDRVGRGRERTAKGREAEGKVGSGWVNLGLDGHGEFREQDKRGRGHARWPEFMAGTFQVLRGLGNSGRVTARGTGHGHGTARHGTQPLPPPNPLRSRICSRYRQVQVRQYNLTPWGTPSRRSISSAPAWAHAVPSGCRML